MIPGLQSSGFSLRPSARGPKAETLRAAAAGEPSADFRRLPDYEPYGQAAEEAARGLGRELEELDLARKRRVAFYPIGAALALLLDETREDWKQEYTRRPFRLPDLPSAGR